MTAPDIKGWCPGALRPMESGDGWLVRIRPPGGVLTPVQAAGIAAASLAHGNGVLDLSQRANLQLRGVCEGTHAGLIADLRALRLIDADIVTEQARNVTVTPFLHAGDDTTAIAARLTDMLQHAPLFPGKFGFAVDTGARPVLGTTPADIRVERAEDGGLILRPDGHGLGMPVTLETVAKAALALLEWFLGTGGAADGRGRMAAHLARANLPDGFTKLPAKPQSQPVPGTCAHGMLVAFAFGQVQAATLATLAALGHDLRITPWRMILIAGADRTPTIRGLIAVADDPLLRVTACTGAPGCAQAQGATRALARSLAAHVASHLHVSGCAKGCAHPAAADVTLVATPRGYNLIRGGRASDAPHLTDLPSHLIAKHLKATDAPSV